jgi:hypothetical protein
VLLDASSTFVAIGVVLGAFDGSLLRVLPACIGGRLEHELLHALPL